VANGACEGSSGACERLSVLVFRPVSCSTWACTSAELYMVRRRSTVRSRKGALAHKPGRWRLTCANTVGRRLRVLRLATAETGSLRLAVPHTCPSLKQSFAGLLGLSSSGLAGIDPGAHRPDVHRSPGSTRSHVSAPAPSLPGSDGTCQGSAAKPTPKAPLTSTFAVFRWRRRHQALAKISHYRRRTENLRCRLPYQ
jgi:hypothetical protein